LKAAIADEVEKCNPEHIFYFRLQCDNVASYSKAVSRILRDIFISGLLTPQNFESASFGQGSVTKQP
jgi:hypothetical protein